MEEPGYLQTLLARWVNEGAREREGEREGEGDHTQWTLHYMCKWLFHVSAHPRFGSWISRAHRHLLENISFSSYMHITSRAHAARPVGPIVTLRFSCLSVCLSVRPCKVWGGLGTSQWRQLATYGCFKLLVCRGTALATQAQDRKSSPRSMGMARNRQVTTNKPRSEMALVLQYSVSYMYKRA